MSTAKQAILASTKTERSVAAAAMSLDAHKDSFAVPAERNLRPASAVASAQPLISNQTLPRLPLTSLLLLPIIFAHPLFDERRLASCLRKPP